MEKGTDKQLLFLDAFTSNVDNNLTTSVFHKRTYTGLLLDFTSFIILVCKIGLVQMPHWSWIKSNDDLMNIKNVILILHI